MRKNKHNHKNFNKPINQNNNVNNTKILNANMIPPSENKFLKSNPIMHNNPKVQNPNSSYGMNPSANNQMVQKNNIPLNMNANNLMVKIHQEKKPKLLNKWIIGLMSFSLIAVTGLTLLFTVHGGVQNSFIVTNDMDDILNSSDTKKAFDERNFDTAYFQYANNEQSIQDFKSTYQKNITSIINEQLIKAPAVAVTDFVWDWTAFDNELNNHNKSETYVTIHSKPDNKSVQGVQQLSIELLDGSDLTNLDQTNFSTTPLVSTDNQSIEDQLQEQIINEILNENYGANLEFGIDFDIQFTNNSPTSDSAHQLNLTQGVDPTHNRSLLTDGDDYENKATVITKSDKLKGISIVNVTPQEYNIGGEQFFYEDPTTADTAKGNSAAGHLNTRKTDNVFASEAGIGGKDINDNPDADSSDIANFNTMWFHPEALSKEHGAKDDTADVATIGQYMQKWESIYIKTFVEEEDNGLETFPTPVGEDGQSYGSVLLDNYRTDQVRIPDGGGIGLDKNNDDWVTSLHKPDDDYDWDVDESWWYSYTVYAQQGNGLVYGSFNMHINFLNAEDYNPDAIGPTGPINFL